LRAALSWLIAKKRVPRCARAESSLVFRGGTPPASLGEAARDASESKPADEKAKVVFKQDAKGIPVIVEKKPSRFSTLDTRSLDCKSVAHAADSTGFFEFLAIR
jgi:hypothetical protein